MSDLRRILGIFPMRFSICRRGVTFVLPILLKMLWHRVPSVHWRCWLGGRKGIRPAKKLSGEVGSWLSVWSKVQTCIWPSWCHCYSLSLASVKSRLVLPIWYRLTRVVPEKGPLNGCVCVCVCVMTYSRIWRYVSTVAASDVTASSYAGYRPCCIVLILSCRGRYIKMVPLNCIVTSYLCTAPVIQSKNIHSIVCQVLDTNLTYSTGPECR